jgi:transcriptional regulator of acetoin/glycerol metabolism
MDLEISRDTLEQIGTLASIDEGVYCNPTNEMNRIVDMVTKLSAKLGINPELREFERFSLAQHPELEEDTRLLRIANIHLHSLFSYVKGSGIILILTNSAGDVLDVIGDSNIVREASETFSIPGTNWGLETTGCNAYSVVITTGHPSLVVKDKHYLDVSKDWTGIGAPIYALDKRLIGVVALSTKGLVYSHTFAMVVATAKAISMDIQSRQFATTITNRFNTAMRNAQDFGRDSGPGGKVDINNFNLHKLERDTILQALKYAKSDISVAAELLGISRATLYRRFKEMGISAQ